MYEDELGKVEEIRKKFIDKRKQIYDWKNILNPRK